MKTRVGFVSNSSTTSFLIYGVWLDGEPLTKAAEKFGWTEDGGESKESAVSEGMYSLKPVKLAWHTPPYEGGVYIGRSWDDVGDEETGAQFKKSTEDLIKGLLGLDAELKFGTHEAAWHD